MIISLPMPSSTVENYLKQILVESIQAESSEVAMGKVAECLQVTPGTATTMMKSLEKKGWLKYRPRKGVMLTSAGRKVGMNMLRRHRLLETFLVETLGLDWGEIHDEAEELEHAISEKVLEKLDEFLGRPSHDPHGDPIPTKRGTMPKASNRSLLDCVEEIAYELSLFKTKEENFCNLPERTNWYQGRESKLFVMTRLPTRSN